MIHSIDNDDLALPHHEVEPLEWLVRFVDDGSYVIRSDGSEWTVEPGEVEEPDVLVTATKDTWARFLTVDAVRRSPVRSGIDIAGTKRAVRTFLKALEVFPSRGTQAASSPRPRQGTDASLAIGPSRLPHARGSREVVGSDPATGP